MHYFEDYFDIPYPLKKLGKQKSYSSFISLPDIVGVPSLRVTAMENWGLILCRQQNFVYTEGIHAKRDRQFVTDVLAHEIAHMVWQKCKWNNDFSSGSAIWSPWNGGMTFGWTKDLQP